jgi:hypothetical protein
VPFAKEFIVKVPGLVNLCSLKFPHSAVVPPEAQRNPGPDVPVKPKPFPEPAPKLPIIGI